MSATNKDCININGFNWAIEVLDNENNIVDMEEKKNLIPSEGLDFLIGAPFSLAVPIPTFYIGLFRGNFMPTPSISANQISTSLIEMTDYSELTRPVWSFSKGAGAVIDNINNKAEFSIAQDRLVYGAFLVSSDAKGSNGGTLLSCVRFSSPKQLSAGNTVRMSCGIAYVS